ncbi:MAG: hypothetical protein K0R75_1165 [Paenibacillaceae bacterium]|jgi:uncharacterized protein YutD|nr:hypothetical protein [Paenibacillaceae bacterium]
MATLPGDKSENPIIIVGNRTYELVKENREGWNQDAFRNRYSEVLERYDYIVGDWGYDQLRLKGFFREGNPKANKETTIASLDDYINEYCNFGCAYFIIEKMPSKGQPKELRESVEVKEPREPKELRDTRDTRDPRELREPRELRPPRESREPRAARDTRAHKEPSKP